MIVAEYITRSIEKRGVTHVFELIGGMITFLLDAASRCTDITLVSMHHEQGAGFAAEGFARMRGIPGVAMATSGPGATNLLTAMGSCYFDSTPAVFITGQVNRHEQKGERDIRQLGFQETDIVSMAKPIAKAAWLINDPAQVPRLLHEAFELALAGRPGPVLLDIPMDVQRAQLSDETPLILQTDTTFTRPAASEESIHRFTAQLRTALKRAQRPLVLAGGGIRSSGSVDLLRKVVEQLQVPVVHSLMGVDLLPASEPLRVGMIGSYGNRWANIALSESDCLIVLGSRLDVRQTGSDVAEFKGDREIFHVDCEQGEINNRIQGCRPLVCELPLFLEHLLKCKLPRVHVDPWEARIREQRASWPDTGELPSCTGLNPNLVMHELAAHTRSVYGFVVDVGQHQMWAAQSLQLLDNQRFLTSGGMGAMGFALPAAIGTSLAGGKIQTVVIAGDGGFQLNIQELQTIKRLNLPIKMLILNNGCHGMVRQFQESYFKQRYQSTLVGYSAPSFTRIAQAYGIDSIATNDESTLEAALTQCFANPHSPFLTEIGLHAMTNAYPKMAFGRPISEMEPHAVPLEMEGT